MDAVLAPGLRECLELNVGGFPAKVATRDALLACCGEQKFVRDGETVRDKEFSLIFAPIFGSSVE